MLEDSDFLQRCRDKKAMRTTGSSSDRAASLSALAESVLQAPVDGCFDEKGKLTVTARVHCGPASWDETGEINVSTIQDGPCGSDSDAPADDSEGVSTLLPLRQFVKDNQFLFTAAAVQGWQGYLNEKLDAFLLPSQDDSQSVTSECRCSNLASAFTGS